MSGATSSDFTRLMVPVALQVLGEPNAALSNKSELRWNGRGSFVVDRRKGVWSDHEAGAGGGVLDFLQRQNLAADKPAALQWLRDHKHLPDAEPGKSKIIATYPYTDAAGEVLFEVVRFAPKDFRQRRPDGNGKWIWNLHGVQAVPFKLPELLRSIRDAVVFITEGERDALALQSCLLIATTNPGGAGKWPASFAQHFAGRRVCILPDADEPGRKHAADVAAKLRGTAAAVGIVTLEGLPEKGDVSDWLQAGGTAEQLEAMAEAALSAPAAPAPEAEPPKPKHGLTVLRPADCVASDVRPYVIKGLIARSDHAQMVGLPGCGKSALAPLAGYCIALGIPFMGLRVRQGPVLYLAAEDGHGMKLRVRALSARLGDAPDFLLAPDPLNLMDDEAGDVSRVLALIREHEPVALFVDTIAKAFPGLRENDSDSMGRVVTVARIFAAEKARPAVITVHHVAKDAGSTPRGHGILMGDLDALMLIEGEKADLRTVRLSKNRNGPSDATFAFNIEAEDFGQDEDGDQITAPIAASVEAPHADRKASSEAKLSDKAAVMLRELRDLIDRHGVLFQPGHDYPMVRGVTRTELRSRLIDRGWFAENLLRTASNGKPELDRSGYAPENHTLTSLKRKRFVSFNREHAWLL